MTVARPWARISLDRRTGRNRHRSGIALVAIGREIDLHRSLPGADDHVRNSHRTAGVEARAKVGVNGRVRANEVNDRGGIRIHRRRRNIFVPETVARERNEPVQARALASGHLAAGAGRATAATASTTSAATATSTTGTSAPAGPATAARAGRSAVTATATEHHQQTKQSQQDEQSTSDGYHRDHLRTFSAARQMA